MANTNNRGVRVKEEEIIQKWKSGLSKNKLAEIYRREFNRQIRMIRSNVRHIHDGKFITNYESLAHIEGVIYKYLKKMQVQSEKNRKNC